MAAQSAYSGRRDRCERASRYQSRHSWRRHCVVHHYTGRVSNGASNIRSRNQALADGLGRQEHDQNPDESGRATQVDLLTRRKRFLRHEERNRQRLE